MPTSAASVGGRRLVAFFSLACWAAQGIAQGGPPLLTDDPYTPGAGNWEINIAFTLEKLKSETGYETPLLDINYGLGERLQLKYEIPWVVLTQDDEQTKNGLGNSNIGVKWRFLGDEDAGFAASVYPQLEFNNPRSSSSDRGLVDNGTSLFLPVEIARELGKLSVNTEFGYLVHEHEDNELVYGLALGYGLTEAFEALGEIHASSRKDFDHNGAVYNLGFRWELQRALSLMGSAGGRLYGRADDTPELLVYAGIQIRLR